MKDFESGSENGELNNGNYSSGFSEPLEQDMAICSDEDDPMKHSHKEEEEFGYLNNAGDHRVSDENVNNFDCLSSLFDQSSTGTCSSNWWDLWSSN